MTRGNQILAAVLVAQLVLVGVVFWPRQAAGGGGGPLFAGLEADQVTRITIRDEDGEQIVLAKSAGNWVLPEADDYPCKEGAVPELLEKIVGLQANRVVAQTRDSYKRLKVSDDEYAHLIELELADGSSHKLYLGTSPSYSAIHVRAGGRDQVYLASGFTGADMSAGPVTWIDTLYFSVPQDQVVAVTLENGNGQFEFEKGADGEWTMVGLGADGALQTSSVTSLVSRVASVRMVRPLGKQEQAAYGLQEPSAAIVIQARSEEGTSTTYTLRVGAKSDGDEAGGTSPAYVLKSSESPYYVHVAEYTARDWVEQTRDDFLVPPPTPVQQG